MSYSYDYIRIKKSDRRIIEQHYLDKLIRKASDKGENYIVLEPDINFSSETLDLLNRICEIDYLKDGRIGIKWYIFIFGKSPKPTKANKCNQRNQ